MLTIAFPAQAFDTNCYVLAPQAGEECVIVDPGVGVEETLREILTAHRLRPAAVLLTHGHVDHVYSVTPVCGADTAAYIHADDRYRLHDLLGRSNPGLIAMFEQQFGAARDVDRADERRRDHRRHPSDPGRDGVRRAARPRAHRGLGDVRHRPGARTASASRSTSTARW